MYIFDLNKLKKGDIILEKNDDQISELVRKLSHSTFSHAILYVGEGSCLEADDIVISFNIQRKLVENKDAVVVSSEENGENVTIKVSVAKEDMGKVIGRNGKVAQSIRAIIKTASNGTNKRYFVKFDEKAE